MDTMNISLPEKLTQFAIAQVTEGGYGSVSEYVAALIQADQREKAKSVIEAEVLKGVLSGVQPMTGDDWAKLRARAAGSLSSN